MKVPNKILTKLDKAKELLEEAEKEISQSPKLIPRFYGELIRKNFILPLSSLIKSLEGKKESKLNLNGRNNLTGGEYKK